MNNVKRHISTKALAVLLAVIMVFSTAAAMFTASAAEGGGEGTWTQGTLSVSGQNAFSYTYSNASISYDIYLPANYESYADNAPGEKLAVMVVMSGGSAAMNTNANRYAMANATGLNYLADKEGIILIYFRQSSTTINSSYYWNWFIPSDQGRANSNYVLPSIVRFTTNYMNDASRADLIDSDRVYVAGFSAGAAMAANFAAVYPDFFKGAAVVAGLPYKCATNAMQASGGSTSGGVQSDPQTSVADRTALGQSIIDAWATAGVTPTQNGDRATRVIVFSGTSDTRVNPINSYNVALANAYAHQYIDEGSATLATDVEADASNEGYAVRFFGTDYDMVNAGYSMDRASDVVYYETTDVSHAWVSENSNGQYGANNDYIDYNEKIWEFFEGAPTIPVVEDFEIKSVSYEIVNGKIIFTIVTNNGDANRVKVSLPTAPGKSIAVADTYVINDDGDRVWTAAADAPKEYTQYLFDARNSEGVYYKDYFTYEDVEPVAPNVQSVDAEIVGNYIYFTVVTTAGDFERIKVTTTDDLNGSIAVAKTYTIDDDGNYVWVIKAPAPQDDTSYAFDIKLNDGGYIRENTVFDYTYDKVSNVKSVTAEVDGDKIYFTVVTVPGDFDRIKVALSDEPNGSIAVAKTYTVNDDGDYVWVIKAPAPEEDTVYAFDVKLSDGSYLKDYFTYDSALVGNTDPIILSADAQIEDGKIVFTVVSLPGDYNRIKVTLADNLAGSIGVSGNYTVNDDGNYVWTVKAAAPEEAQVYAFDLRTSANKYIKEYYTYDSSLIFNQTPVILSVDAAIEGSKIVFTVVSLPGDYNRIKVTLADNLAGSLGVSGSYTVNDDGNYVWTVKAAASEEAQVYAFDLRTEANKYLKNYYTYDSSLIFVDTPVFKNIEAVIEGDDIIFTVTTVAGNFNRVRCGYSESVKDNYINAYTYEVNQSGDYVWTLKTKAEYASSEFFFDVRDAATNQYLKKFAVVTVVVE